MRVGPVVQVPSMQRPGRNLARTVVLNNSLSAYGHLRDSSFVPAFGVVDDATPVEAAMQADGDEPLDLLHRANYRFVFFAKITFQLSL